MQRGMPVGSDQPQIGFASGGRTRARRRHASTALALTFAAVELFRPAAGLSQGTITPFPGQAEPGRNVQAPAPPVVPQFDFSIPAPQRGPVPRAVDVIEFDVSEIKVVGSTVFPPEAFTPLTAPLVGQKAKLSDIVDVADKIESLYRQHGYVLTRAFVPPQTVSNGVFQINVVEGFVKAAAVSGGDDMARERVQAYIDPVTQERPATLGTMERGLLLANDLPGTTASGLLRPSPTEPGASDLLVNLIGQPWEATLYSDNRGSAITGPVTLGAQLVANTLYYVPGQIMVDFSGTPDFSQRTLFQGRYSRPIGYDGLILSLSGVLAHGVPVAAGGNLVSDSSSVGVRLSYPYIVSRALRVSFEGGLTVQSATVTNTGAAAAAVAGLASNVASDDNWREADVAVTVQRRGLLLDFDHRRHRGHHPGHTGVQRAERQARHRRRGRLDRLHEIHARRPARSADQRPAQREFPCAWSIYRRAAGGGRADQLRRLGHRPRLRPGLARRRHRLRPGERAALRHAFPRIFH